jgi:RNA polymerase sigma factor (TIGR02999 family)
MVSDGSGDVTRLLSELSRGDPRTAEELLPLVYDELRRMASYYFRGQPSDHTLQPTALVNEAFLKLAGPNPTWENRTHFLAVAATAMRHVLVNHALARKAEKRGGAYERVELERLEPADEPSGAKPVELDVLALHEILTRLAEIDARKHRIVELRFFGGLSMDEIAKVMSVSKTTVETEWRAVRAWLKLEMDRS